MEILAKGGLQAMVAEAGLCNVMVANFQVVTGEIMTELPLIYGQALRLALQYDIPKKENKKSEEMAKRKFEQDCLHLMTENAIERYEHAMRPMPDGDRFYPAKAYPDDWKEHLTSGFSNIDRMQSSQMYMSDYVKIKKTRTPGECITSLRQIC